MGLSQNILVADPKLIDLLDLHILTVMRRFKCHDLGTIQSFDEDTQTASVSINYSRTIPSPTPGGKSTIVIYPALVNVPVYVAGGGGFYQSFPFKLGDTCLISYNDRDIDNWFQSGQIGPVASTRMHSMSDGIAFVGVRSKANALKNYDTERAVLGCTSGTMVAVGQNLVKIANTEYTLKGLLQQLISNVNDLVTAVSEITVECAAPGTQSGPIINLAAVEAVAVELTTTSNEIAELLE